MIIKEIIQNKKKLYSIVAVIVVVFLTLIFAFSIHWNRNADPTAYVGNADGTNWKGYQSGSLTVEFNETANNNSRKTCKITSDNASYTAHNLIFPRTIQNPITNLNYEVIEIGNNAFQYNITIAGSITLPTSLEIINDYAFSECASLQGDLVIPNHVTTIGNFAFSNVGFAGTLKLSNHLSTIGESAFYQNTFTKDLIFPDSVISIGVQAFEYAGFNGILRLPNNLEILEERTFFQCGFTGKLHIPATVTTINEAAFGNCSKLTGDVIIPNSVSVIGEFIIENCENLNGKLVLPNTITSTLNSFSYTALTSVVFLGENLRSSLFSSWTFCQSHISQFIFDGWNSTPNWNVQNAFAVPGSDNGIVRSINGNLLAETALDVLKGIGLPTGWTAA
ncbi:MAG: leucine-rich repeat domain-containing protein [Mycoplasmataceae bacterium]|nr:leucine-rich repeat domain-containing protein [Mycoplasmataceae bacterium]